MAVYRYIQKVLFNHCDPAGIVFYPRYFEMLNATVETWFETELHCSFSELHMQRRTGVPTAHLDVDFRHPSRLGEELAFDLWVEKLGSRSADCRFAVTGVADGILRMEGKLVLVHISMENGKSMVWPGDLSDRIKIFTTGSAEQENNNA